MLLSWRRGDYFLVTTQQGNCRIYWSLSFFAFGVYFETVGFSKRHEKKRMGHW